MSTVRQKWKYRVIAFGLDGTLLRGPNFDYSWQLVWREQKLPMKLHSQYMENFHDGKWDYTTWCQQVVKKLRSSGLTRDRIATIAAGVSLTKNFHQTVQTLKNEGFSLAIVSGGIDTFIHDAIPDAEKYFDYIFINRATFDSDGLITDVVPTKYDFEGKAEALKYVCRTIGCGEDQSVFVGEGHNDVDAIKLAGLSIAYPPKDSKVYSHADVSIHDDDLSKILEHVLVLDDRAPVSPRQTTKAPATIPASDNSERRVTWLHFSDLHICKLKTGWDSHRVLRTLAADLQQMQADHGLRPDFIFFTGDLAFGHLGNGPGQSITEQFDDGHAFLECARQAFHPHVPQENVFIVPGNHDVNRAECSVAITSWLDGIRVAARWLQR